LLTSNALPFVNIALPPWLKVEHRAGVAGDGAAAASAASTTVDQEVTVDDDNDDEQAGSETIPGVVGVRLEDGKVSFFCCIFKL